eukprot:10264983-Alexandrium_andersonii.AAC.1
MRQGRSPAGHGMTRLHLAPWGVGAVTSFQHVRPELVGGALSGDTVRAVLCDCSSDAEELQSLATEHSLERK